MGNELEQRIFQTNAAAVVAAQTAVAELRHKSLVYPLLAIPVFVKSVAIPANSRIRMAQASSGAGTSTLAVKLYYHLE